jgi:hypothetical protein
MSAHTDNERSEEGGCRPSSCSAFTDEQAHHIANELKRWLEDGCTVKATDPENVLSPLPDGTLYGGMTITGQNDKDQARHD